MNSIVTMNLRFTALKKAVAIAQKNKHVINIIERIHKRVLLILFRKIGHLQK